MSVEMRGKVHFYLCKISPEPIDIQIKIRPDVLYNYYIYSIKFLIIAIIAITRSNVYHSLYYICNNLFSNIVIAFSFYFMLIKYVIGIYINDELFIVYIAEKKYYDNRTACFFN